MDLKQEQPSPFTTLKYDEFKQIPDGIKEKFNSIFKPQVPVLDSIHYPFNKSKDDPSKLYTTEYHHCSTSNDFFDFHTILFSFDPHSSEIYIMNPIINCLRRINYKQFKKYLYFITDSSTFYQNGEPSSSWSMSNCLIDYDYDFDSFIKINCNDKLCVSTTLYCTLTIAAFKYIDIRPSSICLKDVNPIKFLSLRGISKGSIYANGFDLKLHGYRDITIKAYSSISIPIGMFDKMSTSCSSIFYAAYRPDNYFHRFNWCLRSRYACLGLKINSIDIKKCGIANHVSINILNSSPFDIYIKDEFIQFVPHVITQSLLLSNNIDNEDEFNIKIDNYISMKAKYLSKHLYDPPQQDNKTINNNFLFLHDLLKNNIDDNKFFKISTEKRINKL